jgi:hypothetical protein
MVNVQGFVIWAGGKPAALTNLVAFPYLLGASLPKGRSVKAFTAILKIVVNIIAPIPFNLAIGATKATTVRLAGFPAQFTGWQGNAMGSTKTLRRAKTLTLNPVIVKWLFANFTDGVWKSPMIVPFLTALRRAKLTLPAFQYLTAMSALFTQHLHCLSMETVLNVARHWGITAFLHRQYTESGLKVTAYQAGQVPSVAALELAAVLHRESWCDFAYLA